MIKELDPYNIRSWVRVLPYHDSKHHLRKKKVLQYSLINESTQCIQNFVLKSQQYIDLFQPLYFNCLERERHIICGLETWIAQLAQYLTISFSHQLGGKINLNACIEFCLLTNPRENYCLVPCRKPVFLGEANKTNIQINTGKRA